ncbi:MAG: hypothetical protein IT210_15445, partial [Armatimonadetes bacterium]|nr:hypothetical protein [Armatimonadota bacterium]
MQGRPVCAVMGRETAPDALAPETLRLLEPMEHGLARYDVPEGRWRLTACWDVFSEGTIRGVFDEEGDGHAQAPPAGDILNPEAVAAFLRHTHDRYYEYLGEHFGATIIGMFTDEPNPLDGSRRPWPGRAHEGRCETRLRLERREGLVLAVEAGGIPDPQIE